MQGRKVRLAFFSLGGSEYRQIEMSWSTFVLMLLIIIGLLTGLAMGVVYYASGAYQKHQLAEIERDHQKLRENLRHYEQRVRDMADGVDGVNGVDGLMDTAAASEATNDSSVGLQAVMLDAEDNIDPRLEPATTQPNRIGVSASAAPPTDFLSRLEYDFRQNREIQKEISGRFEKDRAQAHHIPTIRPLISGRITDLFGNRSDPFHSRTRHHNGIDIGAAHGTEVYSPAAGFVEMVKTGYVRNRGYGRAVLINHGYGIKTLYGHLSSIGVKHGQKIERWQVIGKVGQTGRATGPHLHYEVWVNGAAKDPLQYILN
jgi:murein DD-endopeptidase MepM/ murein hydrolase activator NlpD